MRTTQESTFNDAMPCGEYPHPPTLESPSSNATSFSDCEFVWYVSYGSNMLRQRFEAYIRGGYVPGSDKWHHGCRDREFSGRSRSTLLDGIVFYASSSSVWGDGGCAFWDGQQPGNVLARAWLVTRSQFDDIHLQENGRNPQKDAALLDTGLLLRTGEVMDAGSLYGRAVVVGNMEGLPAVTFTSPLGFSTAVSSTTEYLAGRAFVPNEPSPAYSSVIRRGIEQMLTDGTAFSPTFKN